MKGKPNQVKIIKEALLQAGLLLKFPFEFDKVFENILQNFSTRGKIDIHDYEIFLSCLFAAINKKSIDFDYILRKFDYADSNKDGVIDKEEFKTEVMKRLREYYYYKSFN